MSNSFDSMVRQYGAHGAFYAEVVSGFHARWVNVGYDANGKMIDLVTEVDYKNGDTIFCHQFRPEGLHITCEGKPEMFVSWDALSNGVIFVKTVA